MPLDPAVSGGPAGAPTGPTEPAAAEGGPSVLKDFRAFLARGNVVDLAVAVVVGGAFNRVVASLVKDMVTPLIAAVGGQPDLGRLFFTVHRARFMYGSFVDALLTFLIVALTVFYVVVLPLNALHRRRGVPTTTKTCSECLSVIPMAAHRCAFCTSIQPAPR